MACTDGQPHVLSPIDFIGDHGPEVSECVECRREFVTETDGTLVPVSAPDAVEAALESIEEQRARANDEQSGAWDGYHHGEGLQADPYWGRLDEPR